MALGMMIDDRVPPVGDRCTEDHLQQASWPATTSPVQAVVTVVGGPRLPC